MILLFAGNSGLASVQQDFFQNADLSDGNNYNPSGVPSFGTDILLTSAATALTLNGASLSVSSLNQMNNTAYVIAGGSLSLEPLNGNVVGANGNDSIYLGGASSSLTIQAALSLVGSNFDVAQSGAILSISGAITVAASNSMVKTGAGTLNLSGSYSAFGGGMTINGGTTNFLAGFSNLTPARTGLVVNNLNAGAGSDVTLNIQTSVQFRGLSGTLALPASGQNTATINLLGSPVELRLEGTILAGGTYAGTIAGNGRVTVNLGDAAATQTLAGNNTYTGTTTVNSGTLRIDGITSGQGNYVVSTMSPATALLTGSGTIGLASNGTITIGGVTATRLSAGGNMATGTLHVVTSGTGGVIIGSQGVFMADIGSAGASDLLAIAGGYIDLTASTDTLSLNSLTGAFDGSSYTIATFAQNLGAGTFNTVTGLPSNYTVVYNSNSIVLQFIPEPATWAFAVEAAVILLLGARLARNHARSRRRSSPDGV